MTLLADFSIVERLFGLLYFERARGPQLNWSKSPPR
jgi:hypothetical protein